MSRAGPNRFNPHPAFRPGDAHYPRARIVVCAVSIRTRPFGRVMHHRLAHVLGTMVAVSIRTRPFGRVMHRHDHPEAAAG